MSNKIKLINSIGFPNMVKDMRGRLANKADYVRDIWLMYNLHQPKIMVIGSYDSVARASVKQSLRDKDEEDLKSGKKNSDQLHKENAHFAKLKVHINGAALYNK